MFLPSRADLTEKAEPIKDWVSLKNEAGLASALEAETVGQRGGIFGTFPLVNADGSLLHDRATMPHEACKFGRLQAVDFLLKDCKCAEQLVNEVSFTGQTPLHLAVLHGHNNVSQMLLNAKADPLRLELNVNFWRLNIGLHDNVKPYSDCQAKY